MRRASAPSIPVQSCPDSIVNGTKQCALLVGIVGCASVGVLSVASVDSATRDAVIAAAVRPRHSFAPTICSTLEIARSGFTTAVAHGEHGRVELVRDRQARRAEAERALLLTGQRHAAEVLHERGPVARLAGREDHPAELAVGAVTLEETLDVLLRVLAADATVGERRRLDRPLRAVVQLGARLCGFANDERIVVRS
jgi:hypothetical protein